MLAVECGNYGFPSRAGLRGALDVSDWDGRVSDIGEDGGLDLNEGGVWWGSLLFASFDRELIEYGGVFRVGDVSDTFTSFFDDFGFTVCE